MHVYYWFILFILLLTFHFFTLASESFFDDKNGKLMSITLSPIHQFMNRHLYTHLAKFRLQHTLYEIYLRQYFVMKPHMHIFVNGFALHNLLDMPIFYYGESMEYNQTSLVARLTESYFNGTFYHGRQVTFFNCHKVILYDSTQRKSTSLKFTCVMYNDREVRKVINELQSARTKCGSEDNEHIHRQALASEYYREYNGYSESVRRQKRNVNSVTCVLHLIADHKFYKHIGGENMANTVGEMVSSVMEADIIFRSTDFNGDGKGDNIGFIVGDITIYTSQHIYGNKFASDNIDVYDYLDILSEYNFDSYCLGIAYTYRDFERGIVGLAWVASSSVYGNLGGICAKRVNRGNGEYQSFNTAIVTYLNYGNNIPSQKSALTLTHELGHSFGSPHDKSEDPQCYPGGIFGTYIMDPYANTGEKPNHRKFSQCSVNTMYPVIVNKGSCFRTYVGPICGNSVVEGNEECDCGTLGTCPYNDPCCTPSNMPSSYPDQRCSIRRSVGHVCSPITSPCCDQSCQIVHASKNHVCQQPTECSMASYCSGSNSSCPPAEKMPDGRLCHGGSKICANGYCSDSICNQFGLEECQCESGEENLCKICCRYTNITNCECRPASEFGIRHTSGDILYHHSGEACNNYKGFCKDRVCLSDDNDGIYRRIKQIFNEQNMQDVGYWLKNFWYYIIIGLALIVIMGGVFKATSNQMKNIDIDTEAWRYGKLMSICQGAENQIQIFEEKKEMFRERFDSKIQDIETDQEYQSPLLAISRLKLLFPDADIVDIADVVHSSTNEKFAVKMLIIKGYSMQKYKLKIKKHVSSSKGDIPEIK